MSTPFDNLPRASFTPDGLDKMYIPVEEYDSDGKLRVHSHTFPHSPGGLPEKMGRELKVVNIKAIFDTWFQNIYPGIWPTVLNNLENAFENQTSGYLQLPTFQNPLRCFCTNWKRSYKARVQSGESVHLVFLEDETLEEAYSQLPILATSMSADMANLQASATTAGFGNIFTALNDAVGQVVAIRDTIQGYSMLAAAKIERVATICQTLNATVADLKDPTNWVIADALRDVWYSAIQLGQDIAQTSTPIQTFVVPYTMTINQLSIAIFGDATHISDLVAMNSFDDVQNIKPQKVRYYAP